MALKSSQLQALTRSGGHPLGLHRVLEPDGVLPQAAKRLDPSLPLYQNELVLEVERLNIDSASFRQLKASCGGKVRCLKERILKIIQQCGKMHNPVTDSGGMLVGRVFQVGSDFPQEYPVGTRLATLVSLTLTPLSLRQIHRVNLKTAQLDVAGYAIVFASGVVAPMPDDLPDDLSLGVFDVCGAPAWVKRLIEPQHRVLVLGFGKAGLLASLAALEVIPPENLVIVDYNGAALKCSHRLPASVKRVQANAQDPIGFSKLLDAQGLGPFDFIVNACNVPETEAACLLVATAGAKVLFFNMATQFGRAVLSAEGIAKDVQLIMGNGFARGHWEYALNLVRRNPWLEEVWDASSLSRQ